MLTPTEARKVAKRARQHGHFQEGFQVFSPLWVKCPQCGGRIYAERDWRNGESAIKALDRGMVAHLRAEYDDEPCPGLGDPHAILDTIAREDA